MTLLKLEFVSYLTKKVAAELKLNRNQLLIMMALGEAGEKGILQGSLVPLFGGGRSPKKYALSMISQALRGTPGRIFAQVQTKNDGRAKILHLTAAGNKLYKKARQIMETEQKALADKVGINKINSLINISNEAGNALKWPG